MAEDSLWMELDLGVDGGRLQFTGVEEAEDWIARERSAWEWAISAGDGGRAGNVSTHINSFFNALSNTINRIKASQVGPDQLRNQLQTSYLSDPAPHFQSKSESGQGILAVRAEMGDEAALLAYSILGGIVGFNPRDRQHFKLLTLVCSPQLLTAEARRTAARASYRAIVSQSDELVAKQKANIREFENRFEQITEEANAHADGLLKRKLRTYVKARRRGWRNTQDAIKSIQATEKTYTDYMHLRASVEYWETKAGEHETKSDTQRDTLLSFVKWGGAAATVVFAFMFLLMLEMSGVNGLPIVDLKLGSGAQIPTTPFVLIAGFLGTVLTALIWAARILVRNYQTERHLKIDADERRIMTMTYLALINEEAALPDEDRLVILNALFRQAYDGSNHDDAPQEVAFPALMAKLLDRK